MADSALRVERVERAEWIGLAAEFADHNYRQTWDFGEHSARRVGAVSEHVSIADGRTVVGIADVRVKRLPVVGGGIAYVTGGPLTRRDGAFDATRFAAAAGALRDEYGVRRGMVVRITAPVGPETWNRDAAAALAAAGFETTTAARTYRTMLVPIDGPVEAVRRALHQKWRNCLNRSERENLVVRAAADTASLAEFTALFDEFVVRKGFDVGLPAAFYAAAQADLDERERFHVLLAEREGKLVAGHVSSALGDTMVYLLGATSPEALTCKAAYLMQWRAIETARARGCRWYDLGGIDPEANPGVHHFKEGLGGADVTAAGPLEWRRGVRARLVLSLEARYRAAAAARAAADAAPPPGAPPRVT